MFWLKAPEACGTETAQRHTHAWTIEMKKAVQTALLKDIRGAVPNERHQSKRSSQRDCGRIDGG